MTSDPPRREALVFARAGAVLALIGVAAGAFGTHALRARLATERLAAFETGVRYQLLHALALFAVAWLAERVPHPAVRQAGWLLLVGTVVFSGSLYALTLSGIGAFGLVTPFGGLALLAGWAWLCRGLWSARA
jgi:uncharacterized membrane protein YgdD (TMEM256/DUF423 family)